MGYNSFAASEGGLERKINKLHSKDAIEKAAIDMADECMREYDINGDKQLSPEESKQIMQNIAKVMIKQISTVIDGMIKSVPPEGQGKLTETLHQKKKELTPKVDDFANALQQQFDSNQDGKLERDELIAGFKEVFTKGTRMNEALKMGDF